MLSSKHIRTLTKIERGKEIRDTKLNGDLEYLRKIGYIEMTVCDKKDDYFAMPYLTEMGMAKLDIGRKERKRNLITLAISIFAAIGGYREEIRWLLQELVKLLR